jgi:hypothetical protein
VTERKVKESLTEVDVLLTHGSHGVAKPACEVVLHFDSTMFSIFYGNSMNMHLML